MKEAGGVMLVMATMLLIRCAEVVVVALCVFLEYIVNKKEGLL